MLEAARARIADLAHGLETPLTVLAAEAGRLRQAGNRTAATTLDGLSRDLHRHIDRERAQARLAGAGGPPRATALLSLADRLVATSAGMTRGERLDWQSTIPADLVVAVDADDLSEPVGNLLDKAAEWVPETVEIWARAAGERVTIRMANDGPGADEADLARLGTRFVRLDATRAGHGIGLSICRDIGRAYGGAIAFGVAACDGLEVSLDLPAAQAPIGHSSWR